MNLPNPTCDLEIAFAKKANALPVSKAKVSRTQHGVLRLFWKAPCPDLGGLSIYVDEHEIILGTETFHTHHDRANYYGQNLSDCELHEHIVDDTIAEALQIMKGEKVFSTSYDSNGNPTSHGMAPLIQSDEAKEHEEEFRKLFPDHLARQRKWTWFGEIIGE